MSHGVWLGWQATRAITSAARFMQKLMKYEKNQAKAHGLIALLAPESIAKIQYLTAG